MLRCFSRFVLPLFACALAAQSPLPDDLAERIREEGIERSHVHRILYDMTHRIGHRLTGSDNFTKACEWAKEEFEKMGIEVELEQWGEWPLVWNRGRWVGRIVSPVERDMYVATDAWTAGTQGVWKAGFVLLPAEVDESFACDGLWVITRRKPATSVRRQLSDAGALGVVYRANDPSKQFPTRVRVFGNSRTARLQIDDVPKMPEIAVRADDFDALYELVEQGKQPIAEFDIENRFRKGPVELHNVIATLRGTEKPDEMVIVSAHLDSWHQAQGTTDNGTGAATTMEAARILTAIGAEPKRTIKFCLWGGEEQGLLGSRGYVQRHRQEMAKVSAVYNHDTGTNWAQSLTVTEEMHAQLEPVFAQVTRLLTPPDEDFDGPVFRLRAVPVLRGGRGGSDHASFLAVGAPGLSWGLKGRSNYFQYTWHTQWDTFDNAIEDYQRHTATVVAMAALGTANLDELLNRENLEDGRRRGRGQAAMFVAGLFGAELDGMKFKSVEKGGRAAKLGVRAGDVLEKVEGRKIESLRQLFQYARESKGDSITLTFRRGEKTFEAEMKKGDLPGRRRR